MVLVLSLSFLYAYVYPRLGIADAEIKFPGAINSLPLFKPARRRSDCIVLFASSAGATFACLFSAFLAHLTSVSAETAPDIQS